MNLMWLREWIPMIVAVAIVVTMGRATTAKTITAEEQSPIIVYTSNYSQVEFFIGFELDGFKNYSNLSNISSEQLARNGGLLTLGPEVKGNPATPIEYNPKIPYMTYGQRLRSIDDTKYVIEVGLGSCDITEITDDFIPCRLPPRTPEPRDANLETNGLRAVQIHIWGAIVYRIGFVKYPVHSVSLVIGAVVGGAALMAAAVITTVLLVRRNRRRRDRERREMEARDIFSVRSMNAKQLQREGRQAQPWQHPMEPQKTTEDVDDTYDRIDDSGGSG